MKEINEIRHNYKTNHFSWLFGKKGNMRVSAGLTHEPKSKINGKVVKNIKLPQNPNPKEEKRKIPSYFNSQMQRQHKRSYANVDKIQKDNWKMSAKNKQKVLTHFGKRKATKNGR